MAKKRKRKWVWIGADRDRTVCFHAQKEKPTLNFWKEWESFSKSGYICIDDFNAATGLNLKPGDCVKVEFSAKVVK